MDTDPTVRPASPSATTRIPTWLVAVLSGLGFVLVYLYYGFDSVLDPTRIRYHLDAEVYRVGARQLLDGLPLYGELPPMRQDDIKLPFTYPPFAALLFVPLAIVPLFTAMLLVHTISVLALLLACVIGARMIDADIRGSRLLRFAAPIALIAILAEPVTSTLGYGQVNNILLAMVVADALLPRTFWPRGMLIGLAAAIKLTPAVFVLFFLVRKDFRAALTAVGSAIAATLIAWAVIPADAYDFWFGALRDPERIGDLTFAHNQSINGVLARLGGPDLAGGAIWMLAVVVTIGIAATAMWFLARAGRITEALLVNALIALLCSPVSWTHHWVWMAVFVPILGILAVRRRDVLLGLIAAVGIVVAWSRPMYYLPKDDDVEVTWSLLQAIPGNAFVLWGLLALVGLTVSALRTRTASPGAGEAADETESVTP